MEIKKIKCPKCGVVLEVKNSKNEAVKIFKCPQCGVTLRVRFHDEPADNPLDAHTHIADSGKTHIATQKGGLRALIVCNAREYDLSEGRNVVGRKSPKSTADIQIETTDRYMSRHDAIVNVNHANGQLIVSIANYQNKSTIVVGNMEMDEDDEIRLFDGDEFMLGETKMKLRLKAIETSQKDNS